MSGAFSRIGRTFLRYLVKTAFLLLAVSIIAFALVIGANTISRNISETSLW